MEAKLINHLVNLYKSLLLIPWVQQQLVLVKAQLRSDYHQLSDLNSGCLFTIIVPDDYITLSPYLVTVTGFGLFGSYTLLTYTINTRTILITDACTSYLGTAI
jgi:hypothetical protein